jgi:hypothetical protein
MAPNIAGRITRHSDIAQLAAGRHGHPHRTSIDDPTSSPAISRYILPIGPFMISLAVFFCSSLRTE